MINRNWRDESGGRGKNRPNDILSLRMLSVGDFGRDQNKKTIGSSNGFFTSGGYII
jgi:hypothetical protein